MDVARIYRRTPTTETIQTCVASIRGKQGPELEAALRMELKSVLMSLPFIYRGLLATVDDLKVSDQDDSPVSYGRVDDHELAERLSYFLWGDMPMNDSCSWQMKAPYEFQKRMQVK